MQHCFCFFSVFVHLMNITCNLEQPSGGKQPPRIQCELVNRTFQSSYLELDGLKLTGFHGRNKTKQTKLQTSQSIANQRRHQMIESVIKRDGKSWKLLENKLGLVLSSMGMRTTGSWWRHELLATTAADTKNEGHEQGTFETGAKRTRNKFKNARQGKTKQNKTKRTNQDKIQQCEANKPNRAMDEKKF